MKKYLAPTVKTLVISNFMFDIFEKSSPADQLGNSGMFEEEDASSTIKTKSVWD